MAAESWESVTWDWIEREIVECLFAARDGRENPPAEPFAVLLAERSKADSVLLHRNPKAKREH